MSDIIAAVMIALAVMYMFLAALMFLPICAAFDEFSDPVWIVPVMTILWPVPLVYSLFVILRDARLDRLNAKVSR